MAKLKLQHSPQPKLEQKLVDDWNSIVLSILKKSHGEKAGLPKEGVGTYVRYAFDGAGRLSLGHRKGRIKPHRSHRSIRISQLVPALFAVALRTEFELEAHRAKQEEREVKPINQETVNRAQAWAQDKAKSIVDAPAKQARSAAKRTQKASRRLGFGLLQGNQARCVHSGN